MNEVWKREMWRRWNPIDGLEKQYQVDEITYDENGFIVWLSCPETGHKRLKIYFKGGVKAYQSSIKTSQSHLIGELERRYGKTFYEEWAFFRVINSSYLQWLSEQSSTISDHFKVEQISIIGTNQVVDIATTYEPTVTME